MTIDIKVRLSKTLFSSDAYQVVVFNTITGHEKTSFTACGSLPKLHAREEIVVTGEFKTTEKFGNQFQVTSWKRPIPDTKEQLIQFFSSALFKGVGKKMAEKIVKELGKNAVKRIVNEGAGILHQVESMKDEMADMIAEVVQRTFVLNELIEQYAAFGIPSETLLKAHLILGQKTHELKNNPYLLAHHHLVHLATADEIGKKLGMLPHASERLNTVIHLSLKEFIVQQGHCYLEESQFLTKCLCVLNQKATCESDEVHHNSLIQALESSKETFLENGLVYPTNLYFAERDLVKAIHQLSLGTSIYDSNKIATEIRKCEVESGSIFSEQQKSVVHELIKENVLILTGGPGTGKTYTMSLLMRIYKRLFPQAEVGLAAPTGRAAKRLGEVTGMGSHAQTIHRLLGIGVLGHDRALFDEAIPLPQELFIIDEFSMVDTKLASMLFKAIQKGSKVLIVGDPDQLPSVGAGNVLKDLMDAGIPQIRLTEIFRQAQESTIIKNAHSINKGQEYDFTNHKDQFFIESLNPRRTADFVVASVARFLSKGYDLQDILVLSPMKKGDTGIESLNEVIRDKINPASSKKKEVTYLKQLYRENDKVIFTANNRDLDVYNGDTGMIRKIDKANKIITVEMNGRMIDFEMEQWRHLQLAFAMTIHKAQGGQAKVVITVLSDEHDLMLTRNLFFTAITRAEEIHVLIGSKQAAVKAIKNNRVRDRKTTLNERLKESRKYISYAKCVN